MHKWLFLFLILVTTSFSSKIPKTTSYGGFAQFGKSIGLVAGLRQPMGDQALDLYVDFLDFGDFFGVGGQYFFFAEDLFPIRDGKLLFQYGPGLGLGLAPSYMDFSLEPAAGFVLYLDKKPVDVFFNVVANFEFQFFGDDYFDDRLQESKSFDLDFNPTVQLGMRYAF